MAIRPHKQYARTNNTPVQTIRLYKICPHKQYAHTRVNEPRRKKEEGHEGRRKRRVGQLVLEVTRLFFVKALKYL